ncbi:MAG: aminodeoxychorismate/anthranilate synthase component II [Desulfobacterales bacterium]|nr:aminodeoxychorismate/anthranilate synthase component II [Desulfobacterales bacterium]
MAGEEVRVFRNNTITVDEIRKMKPSGIIISPGPGRPESAGVTLDLIQKLSGEIPILGVCLGHQSIAQAFGGRIIHAKKVMHGKISELTTNGEGLFRGISSPMKAMRYHSLAVEEKSLPGVLQVTAQSEDDEIMGIRHKSHLTMGLQFHPESIMTTTGKRLIKNFLRLTRETA